MAQNLFLRVRKGDICPKILKQGSRRRVRKKHRAIPSPDVHRLKFTGEVLKQEVALLKVLELDAEWNIEAPRVCTSL